MTEKTKASEFALAVGGKAISDASGVGREEAAAALMAAVPGSPAEISWSLNRVWEIAKDEGHAGLVRDIEAAEGLADAECLDLLSLEQALCVTARHAELADCSPFVVALLHRAAEGAAVLAY